MCGKETFYIFLSILSSPISRLNFLLKQNYTYVYIYIFFLNEAKTLFFFLIKQLLKFRNAPKRCVVAAVVN